MSVPPDMYWEIHGEVSKRLGANHTKALLGLFVRATSGGIEHSPLSQARRSSRQITSSPTNLMWRPISSHTHPLWTLETYLP